MCQDGTYSDNKTSRACNRHGGPKAFGVSPIVRQKQILESHPSAVYLIPVRDISFDRALFQNRDSEYSEESVNRIIEAVNNGSFKWEVFDPILLWKNGKKLIVLSGHSRTEAFTLLAQMGNKDFKKIPAKIIEATRAEARKIALESNTLSTNETDTERANYYRQLREQEGLPPKSVEQAAKKNEGKDANRILNYSFLNRNGKALFALKALEGKDDTSNLNIKSVANWIGAARRRYPQLSNLHEDELYTWLIGGAYGRQYTRLEDFLNKVYITIQQRTQFGKFDQDKALNIQNLGMQSHGEQQYNAMRSELLINVRRMEKDYKEKIKELERREASQADKNRILQPIEMRLRTARQKLLSFDQKATKPLTAARSELNLFAISGRPKYLCL